MHNFRLISVLKLVVTIIKIDSFHKKVKRPRSLLNGMKIRQWWMLTLHLIRVLTIHLVRVLTLHLIRMILRRYIINIREMILINGWLWAEVITRVERVFWDVAVVFPSLGGIGKFTVDGLHHVERIGSRIYRLLGLGSRGALDLGQVVGCLGDSSDLPLVLGSARVLELLAVANFNVGDYSFAFLTLGVLVTNVMLVKSLVLLWIWYCPPFTVPHFLSCTNPGNG